MKISITRCFWSDCRWMNQQSKIVYSVSIAYCNRLIHSCRVFDEREPSQRFLVWVWSNIQTSLAVGAPQEIRVWEEPFFLLFPVSLQSQEKGYTQRSRGNSSRTYSAALRRRFQVLVLQITIITRSCRWPVYC